MTPEERQKILDASLGEMPDIGRIFHSALTGGKKMVDTAANYYSGLTGALDPNKEPIPVEDLVKEAISPSGENGKMNVNLPYGPPTHQISSSGPSSVIASLTGMAADPVGYYRGPTPLAGVLNEVGDNVVFHGTPHNFEVPSLSKMGTGEGNQAYGPGFYTADNPKVAEFYRKNLSQGINRKTVSPTGDIVNSGPPGGNLMSFKIPPPDKFLDYEKTLGDLPEHVKDVLPEADMARRYEDNYTKAMHDVEASLPYLKQKVGRTDDIEHALENFKSGMDLSPQFKGTAHSTQVGPITDTLAGMGPYLHEEPIINHMGKNLFNAYAGPTNDMPLSTIVGDLPPETMNALVGKGIAGVRYPDAVSRTGVKTKPTFNYTLFNPEKDAQLIDKVSSPTPDDVESLIRKALTGGYR